MTIEDLLEEIVGEIEDEYDRVEHPIVRISDNEALLDGRVSIDELNDMFHATIDAADFDTVGGCVFHHLGRVPAVGDVVETDGVRLSVLSVDGHRVRCAACRRCAWSRTNRSRRSVTAPVATGTATDTNATAGRRTAPRRAPQAAGGFPSRY